MRLWGYYAFHTFKNSVKKLLKTWLGFFLIIMVAATLLGACIGLITSKVSQKAKENKAEVTENVQEEEEKGPSYFEINLISKEGMTELITSGVIIGVLLMAIFGGKNAGTIFKPADVAILFPAPLRPQSVMMFRLIFALGMQVIASVYMVFQLPNLVINAGLPMVGAIAILVAWLLLMVGSTVLQVTLYTLMTMNEKLNKIVNTVVYVVLGAAAVGFLIYNSMNGEVILKNAINYFASPSTLWVPVWGWLRAVVTYALDGDILMSALFAGLTLLGYAALIFLIWNLKADFYEEAIYSVEKNAEAVEKAKSNGTGVVRTKERSAKIDRSGIGRGSGANIFFFKTLYNRKRFAILGVFTKTMLLYIAIAAFLSYLLRNFSFGYTVIGAVLTFAVFLRTLGNPIKEDTTRNFFFMIPESAHAKLLYSILGGSVCCAFDLLLPVLGAGIFFKASADEIILWLLMALSIDFFGSIVGAFIGLSVPVSAGDTIKQLVQVMFIYIGALPAAGFVAVGIVFDKPLLFGGFGVLFNIIGGLIFFSFTPAFFENGCK